jgi:hypothetical protein
MMISKPVNFQKLVPSVDYSIVAIIIYFQAFIFIFFLSLKV